MRSSPSNSVAGLISTVKPNIVKLEAPTVPTGPFHSLALTMLLAVPVRSPPTDVASVRGEPLTVTTMPGRSADALSTEPLTLALLSS